MMDCPYCQNPAIRYSRVMTLHVVRMLISSQKRYCPRCEKKWRVRPKNPKNYSFYIVVMPLIIGVALGLVKITDRGNAEIMSSSSVSAKMDKNGASANTPFFMNKKLMAKAAKYRNDPKALAKLTGSQKKMAEQYLKRYQGGG